MVPCSSLLSRFILCHWGNSRWLSLQKPCWRKRWWSASSKVVASQQPDILSCTKRPCKDITNLQFNSVHANIWQLIGYIKHWTNSFNRPDIQQYVNDDPSGGCEGTHDHYLHVSWGKYAVKCSGNQMIQLKCKWHSSICTNLIVFPFATKGWPASDMKGPANDDIAPCEIRFKLDLFYFREKVDYCCHYQYKNITSYLCVIYLYHDMFG